MMSDKPIVMVVGNLSDDDADAVRAIDDRILVIQSDDDPTNHPDVIKALARAEDDIRDVMLGRDLREYRIAMAPERPYIERPYISTRSDRDWENNKRGRMKPRRR